MESGMSDIQTLLPNMDTPELSSLSLSSSPAFQLFVNLPTELRLKIWEHALPGPRIVYLRCKQYSNGAAEEAAENYDGRTAEDRRWYISSPNPTPVMLRVCRESREITLGRYERTFSTETGSRQVYFDHAIDTVFLDWQSFNVPQNPAAVPVPWDPIPDWALLNSALFEVQILKDLCKVQRLAIRWYGGDKHSNLYPPSRVMDLLDRFQTLEELIIGFDECGALSDQADLPRVYLQQGTHAVKYLTTCLKGYISGLPLQHRRVCYESCMEGATYKFADACQEFEDMYHEARGPPVRRNLSRPTGPTRFYALVDPRVRFATITTAEKWRAFQELEASVIPSREDEEAAERQAEVERGFSRAMEAGYRPRVLHRQ